MDKETPSRKSAHRQATEQESHWPFPLPAPSPGEVLRGGVLRWAQIEDLRLLWEIRCILLGGMGQPQALEPIDKRSGQRELSFIAPSGIGKSKWRDVWTKEIESRFGPDREPKFFSPFLDGDSQADGSTK